MSYVTKWITLSLGFGLVGCVNFSSKPDTVGLTEGGRLHDCPDKPNCVSSYGGSEEHAMNAWSLAGKSPSEVKPLIKKAAEQVAGEVDWQSDEPNYLHGVVLSSLLKFPDDIEFFIDEGSDKIHFRSASRHGYSDLGKNRERMTNVKQALDGLIQ